MPGKSGYAHLPVTKVPGWYGMIAWDALLNGMATGLFMAAAVSELAAPAVFIPVAKVAYPVALVLLLVDLALLVSDLGDPLRFHHMLRVFKPRSPMSVGTWCLTIFSLPLTAAAALSLLSEAGIDFEWARILAVVVGLLPGFGSAGYNGVSLANYLFCLKINNSQQTSWDTFRYHRPAPSCCSRFSASATSAARL